MIHTFAAGDSTLSTTVQTGYVTGGRVTGAGGGQDPTSPTFQSDEQSRVTVEANPGIYVQGTAQEVRDISFLGPGKDDLTYVDGSGNPMRAILMSHPDGTSGMSQGRCMFSNLNFADFPTAIQIGRDNTSSWGDTSDFRMISAQRCAKVVHLKNNQSMSNTYTGVFAEACDLVFDMEAGGTLDCRTVTITQVDEGETCTLLRTGQSTYIGHHSGTVILQGIKIDSQVLDRVCLIEMTDDAACDFNVIGGLDSSAAHIVDYDNPLFIMQPRGVLNINGLRGLYPQCILLQGTTGADPISLNVFCSGIEADDPGFDVRDLISPDSEVRGVLNVIAPYQHRSSRAFFRSRFGSRVGAGWS